MKVSPHCHPESFLTGSTTQSLVDRAVELNRTHFSYTDHGYLTSCLKAYGMAKKKGLKFISGIEIYFKDDNCPVIAGTSASRCRYFTLTLYCQDADAYQALCKMASREDMPSMTLHEEKHQLWSWKDLEYMSKFNVNVVLGGIHCIVGKLYLAGSPDLGEMVLLHLKNIMKGRVYSSLVCEPWSKKWYNVVEIKYKDGTKDSILGTDMLTTDKARRIKAMDLIDRPGHSIVESKYVNNTFFEVGKQISDIVLHKGFLPLPGGDAMLKVNLFLRALSKKHQIKVLATDYAYYANKEDKLVQTMRLEGENRLQPNFYMKSEEEVVAYLATTMLLNEQEINQILSNNDSWSQLFDKFELKYDWRLADPEGNPLKKAMDIIKQNGRMHWDNPTWVNRLKEELEVIAKNPKKDLTAYFLPICDVLNYYKENNQLTGPGRGSAAGSLLVYLLGITQVNPFKHDLSFNRFFSLDRIMGNKIPDIDTDLEQRTILVGDDGKSGYLYGRWGDKAAQIGTRTTIRLKSAIKDTNRYFNGKVEPEIELLSKGLPAPPQGISDRDSVFGFEDEDGNHIPGLIEQSEDLKKYINNRPKEWEIVQKSLGITRAHSRHASAFILSDIPIKNLVPLKDGYVTQYEAKECEVAGLIKYDFLVVNQLKDIRICMELINKKYFGQSSLKDEVGWWHNESDSGLCANCENPRSNLNSIEIDIIDREMAEKRQDTICDKCKKHFKYVKKLEVGKFVYNEKELYVWDLPEDEGVFKSIWTGNTETCFQINTKSMTPFVIDIKPKNIEDISIIQSLVRPGPLDYIDPKTNRSMAQEYVHRRNGGQYEDIKILDELIPETYGVLVYQEQVTKIAKLLAGFNGQEAETLRENIGKKKKAELLKTKPKFISGCLSTGKISPSEAETLWDRIETFGRYAFNKSHGISYSYITYACMFLKHHYPLEWWAAVLTNADESEITGKFWPYVKDKVMPPDINLSGDTMVVDYNIGKIRAKLGVIRGMGEASVDPILKGRPYKDINDFVNKEVAGPSLSRKLIHVGVLDSLFPSSSSLLEKLKAYEDALESKSYSEKVKKANENNKVLRATGPRQGKIPEEYVNITPLQDAAMRKSVLPSLPIDLHSLGVAYSRVRSRHGEKNTVRNGKGFNVTLIDGRKLQHLDEIKGTELKKDAYVASTCFVIKTEEFAYPKANPTKKALKIILDADGYVSEKVLWPNYETGELLYPKELKRGVIATIFMKRRKESENMCITEVVVESK